MEATKTITTTKNGKDIEITITRTIDVRDKTVNADGHIINLGKETVDRVYIALKVNGKFVTRDYGAPSPITKAAYPKTYKELISKGAYARLGDGYIGEDIYNLIMAAIAELDADLAPSQEFEAVKAAEDAKTAAQDAADMAEYNRLEREIKNGLCPKCGTYCYGDCGAN
jgi:hypothetical protein